jgi:hypothetical protein
MSEAPAEDEGGQRSCAYYEGFVGTMHEGVMHEAPYLLCMCMSGDFGSRGRHKNSLAPAKSFLQCLRKFYHL